MHSRKPWKRAGASQPYKPWNLQLLKAARERPSTSQPPTPEPTTPATPTEPVDQETVQYEAVNHSVTISTDQRDTTPNAPAFTVPTPAQTPEPTPIDELPPWVDTPELRPRRDTVESIQSTGSNWGAGPLVNDWSQFESQMKNVKESSSSTSELPSETEISPSTSMDSTSQPLVGELVNVDDGVPNPVDPSTWSQLDMSPMAIQEDSPTRARRSRLVQEDDDDGLEWVTNDTYQPEQNTEDLQRYSREQLFNLSDYVESAIGYDAANRIDEQIQMRRTSTRNERKPDIRVIREVRQPPDDHSGGFSPGIPQPTKIRMLTVYEAL